jgi:hypothetical protein
MSGRELTFTKSGTYDLVFLEGAAMTTTVGAPSLPAMTVNVVIPQGMRVQAVTCGSVATEDVAGTFLIMPVQPPRPQSDTDTPASVPPDPAVYASSAPYPSEVCKPAGQNSMFGYNVASLLVYPLQYSPKSKTLRFHRKLTLNLVMEPADLGYLPVGNRSAEARERVENDVRAVVLNPEDVSRFAPKEQ